MKVGFYFEHGEIPEIGTGHRYRAKVISEELRRRGHEIVEGYPDILVVDHLFEQTNRIQEIKAKGIKVVLIDGIDTDAALADLSISAFYNKSAKYRGIEYMAFPSHPKEYYKFNNNEYVFVGMGGFDAGNLTDMAINSIRRVGKKALVAKSINSQIQESEDVKIFDGIDYFDAMKECMLGVTAGGLTMFQALHFGLPCVCVPQYEHQIENISSVRYCCLGVKPTESEIVDGLRLLIDDERCRNTISLSARSYVDGNGVNRICDLIEGLK